MMFFEVAHAARHRLGNSPQPVVFISPLPRRAYSVLFSLLHQRRKQAQRFFLQTFDR